ncbi:aminomethyl-transferring glycine dehydrogenase [Methylicorpusculum sp.]|uniref:aminomethyl-transferring glycine dehydrogenase n=1 Tax=Methylicorpusculum sp. TaxID=2713644 RepID=UPI0027243DD4|nr:aminomethyl-transferring glycine dehydrogenase [Methylicorpusculum sp.]MDO8844658.1 aminomethyl-transferring glycine dehydrogenase [Methylicorpusculum sp.]
MQGSKPQLQDLEMRGNYINRHIGSNETQLKELLETLELTCLEDIVEQAFPCNIVNQEPLKLTEIISESAVFKHLAKMRQNNKVLTSLIGMGYYNTDMPAVIKRNVLENPGWYTAYTPYQAEVSQGRLEALINFQQMIIDLTGMELANSSLLDEATAAAEAMSMSKRLSDTAATTFFVDQDCHPQTIAVIKTRARSLGYEIITGPVEKLNEHQNIFGILVQNPGCSGAIKDLTSIVAEAHKQSALVTVASDLLSLVLLKPPAAFGADIVVGNTQRFGVPMGYGGPHAAFFATKEAYKRSVPGRIIGVSKDNQDQPAYRLALQTREQHIRRDKATSNICTAQVLLAVIAGFYAVYHGPEGLRMIAGRVHRYTQILAAGLEQLGFQLKTHCYFDTVVVCTPGCAATYLATAEHAGINLRFIDEDHLGMSLDETSNREIIRKLWRIFAADNAPTPDINLLDEVTRECIPNELLRSDPILQHPVFAKYHSETEMMRYMRRLARRDIALDRAMIPLGSCTMKLNAATAMQTISYSSINGLHPFVPLHQAEGYRQLFDELEDMLCDLTGFDAFSFQPNAGSQGEYTGLLVIRKYHEVMGQGQRDICLIPASAHGTNPASASLAGLKVVVLACDDQGNVSLDDLRDKAVLYKDTLAAIMITYPSTHGVFEEAFCEICTIVHENGGQVYMDGANFNALVGISRPGKLGADVAHLNLHKTFSIPHGGGGPGAGPIGVGAHLAPFLPDHPVVKGVNRFATEQGTVGTVSAAPWGSASILTISWAYIAMMGAFGLKKATLAAILNANYIAKRLAPHFPILYTGKNGWVAHECIIDCSEFKKTAGVSVDDIAKRLIDYGFHAPTVAFPVADTLMIEPTESESKIEIDRFCDALISIRLEIAEIQNGSADPNNNLLHNAPHTHRLLLAEWQLPYSRQQAFFPDNHQHDDKYWPPVGRIDNVYGDRHLICSCPPLSDYE